MFLHKHMVSFIIIMIRIFLDFVNFFSENITELYKIR